MARHLNIGAMLGIRLVAAVAVSYRYAEEERLAANGCLPAAPSVYLDFTYGHLGPVQWAVDDGAGQVWGDPVGAYHADIPVVAGVDPDRAVPELLALARQRSADAGRDLIIPYLTENSTRHLPPSAAGNPVLEDLDCALTSNALDLASYRETLPRKRAQNTSRSGVRRLRHRIGPRGRSSAGRESQPIAAASGKPASRRGQPSYAGATSARSRRSSRAGRWSLSAFRRGTLRSAPSFP